MRHFETYERKTKRELVNQVLASLGLDPNIRGHVSKRVSKWKREKLEDWVGVTS